MVLMPIAASNCGACSVFTRPPPGRKRGSLGSARPRSNCIACFDFLGKLVTFQIHPRNWADR